MKFTTFHKSKDDILNNTSARLKVTEQLAGKQIQICCRDNAEENKVLEQDMRGQHWLMKTKFKYTASVTPQHNSYAEMGLQHWLVCRASW